MWQAPPHTPEADLLYAKAEQDRLSHPERYELTPKATLDLAFEKYSLAGDDNGDWKEGLEIYLQSAREEGRLNALGVRNVLASASGRLKARISIARALEKQPEIRDRQIDRPIFIIGGWRTGTTLLQRLLSALPGLRGAYPAELTAPWRFIDMTREDRQTTLAAGEGAHQRLHVLNPTMWSIHPSGARLAEECVLAMGSDLRNWGFTSTLRCPSYAAWLLEQDFRPSYRRYGDILRLLQDQSGDRWLLKAPAHTAELKALLDVFPDACILHLHRDVVQTVTSGASLFAVFRSTYSDDVDPKDVGRYQLDMTETWFQRAMKDRESAQGAKIFDIAFPELASDPIAMARKVCAHLGLDWSEKTEIAAQEAMIGLKANHASHRYAPEDFGLDREEILERFTPYRNRFNLD